ARSLPGRAWLVRWLLGTQSGTVGRGRGRADCRRGGRHRDKPTGRADRSVRRRGRRVERCHSFGAGHRAGKGALMNMLVAIALLSPFVAVAAAQPAQPVGAVPAKKAPKKKVPKQKAPADGPLDPYAESAPLEPYADGKPAKADP